MRLRWTTALLTAAWVLGACVGATVATAQEPAGDTQQELERMKAEYDQRIQFMERRIQELEAAPVEPAGPAEAAPVAVEAAQDVPPDVVAEDTDSEADARSYGSFVSRGAGNDWQPSRTENETWGLFKPGKGFLVGRTPRGELSLSSYVLLRYINQMPSSQTFTDHLGNERPVDNREDFFSHRILVWLKGWLLDPKFVYQVTLWALNATDQDAFFGNLGYQFHEKFNLYAGIAPNGGSRTMLGSHPYWLGTDRVMADEFFRPFFSQGIYAQGKLFRGMWYHAMVGNNSSSLGGTADKLDRNQTVGGSLWWMPTTGEFGPRGGYGDFAMHEELATRFGLSGSHSPEQRYTDVEEDPSNTTLRLADSLNLFSTGALAPGVTVLNADYEILSLDAGLKYQGYFLQTQFYHRWLSGFDADGEVPVDEIIDWGFDVQASFFPIPKTLELYVATSQIFGDEDAGFGDSYEYILGANYYPFDSRDVRLNLQFADVHKSPASSAFGYYNGGQDGETVSVGCSMLF